MRPLTAEELLRVFEHGRSQGWVRRALALLAAACPESDAEELARMSIGRRDALLLTLREWTFGSRLACLAACPHCGERLELAFDCADIRAAEYDLPAVGEALALVFADREVRFRLPDSLDALAVAGPSAEAGVEPGAESGRVVGLAAARQALLERCLLDSPEGPLPEGLADEVSSRMAEADPQADVRLALDCPSCAHAWPAAFDVVAFFWREIEAWAARLLREVHILAVAYGWREHDVLALSPWRRQAYLEMVGG